MIAVIVNHATLARWQQELRLVADNLQFHGAKKIAAARALRRIAEEDDLVLAPESAVLRKGDAR